MLNYVKNRRTKKTLYGWKAKKSKFCLHKYYFLWLSNAFETIFSVQIMYFLYFYECNHFADIRSLFGIWFFRSLLILRYHSNRNTYRIYLEENSRFWLQWFHLKWFVRQKRFLGVCWRKGCLLSQVGVDLFNDLI